MRLALVTLVVRNYDEAKDWYADKLGFSIVENTDWQVASAGS